MATIVRHRRTGNEYILLGINGGENRINPSRFINELFDREKAETSSSATVCDAQGNLFLAYIDDLIVTEIDGQQPAEILPEVAFAEPAEDFDDEELAEEDFDDSPSTPDPLEIPTKDSNDGNENNFDEDDEDWI